MQDYIEVGSLYGQDEDRCLFSCYKDKDVSLQARVMVIRVTVRVVSRQRGKASLAPGEARWAPASLTIDYFELGSLY